jgi:myo-inositol catabolism protein IolC
VGVWDDHQVAVGVWKAVENHVTQPAAIDDVSFGVLQLGLDAKEAALRQALFALEI